MKIIFDHSAPAPLAKFLAGHTVSTCGMLGWTRMSNGELLDFAEAAGFELMITCDQNVKYQQNLARRRISLIVLGSNDWSIVKGYVDVISASVEAAVPSTYLRKLEYLALSADGKTTAFRHSNGAAVSL